MARARVSPQEKYHEAVMQAFQRMLSHVVRAVHTEFTYEEVLELSVPPDIQELLLQATIVAQPLERGTSSMYLSTPVRNVQFHFGNPVLLPKQPVWQENMPPELREKFDEWLNARVQVGIDYGRVRRVLELLIGEGCTPKQQRHFLPSIKVLWQQDEYLRKLVDKHATHQPRQKLPMLSYELRGSLIAAFETLNVYATLGIGQGYPSVQVVLERRLGAPEQPLHRDPEGLEFTAL